VHPDLEACRDGLRRALAGVSPVDAEIAPHGQWSIANIIEHLDLTYTRNAAGLERRLGKGDAPERRRTLRQSAIRTLIVTLGYFPPGRTAPTMVVPQGRPFTDVASQLDDHLEELDRCLSEGERVFGATRAVLDHPVIGPFSVADWRRFHWVHTRHHLKQIQARSSKFELRN
jgi:hypothetical protein